MTSAKEYVKLEYRLPNGQAAKFLNEAKTYLGNQLECEYGGDRCFGVVADMDAKIARGEMVGSWLKTVLKILRILRISTDLVIHSGLIYHQILNMFLNEK